MPSHDSKYRRKHVTDVDLAKRLREMCGHQLAEISREGAFVGQLATDTEAQRPLDERRSIGCHQRDQDTCQGGPRRGINFADHSEVDEADASVGLDEEVPGVRVGVEEAVFEDGSQDKRRRTARERDLIDPRRGERVQVVDLEAAKPLERQYSCSAEIVMDRWNADVRVC